MPKELAAYLFLWRLIRKLFSRKSRLTRRNTIAQNEFWATVFRLPHKRRKRLCVTPEATESFQTDDAKPISFALMSKRCFYGFSDGFLFSWFLLCRKRKAVCDHLPHEWHKPSYTASKPGRIGIRPPKQVSTNGCPYFPWGGLPGFTLPAVYSFITVFLFCLGRLF